MSKGKKIALWTISILLGAMFVFTGLAKLMQLDNAKVMFVHYGYPPWFAVLIGISEVLGGIGLLVPRLAAIAAIGISIIMAGATYTHFTHQQYGYGLIPIVLILLLIMVARMRFKENSALGQ